MPGTIPIQKLPETRSLIDGGLPPCSGRLRFVQWTMWLVVVLAVAAPPGVCQVQKHKMPRAQRHEYKHEVEKCEETWRTAMLKGDSTDLVGLLADDYTGITSAGAIETKQEAIDSVRSGKFKLTNLEVSDRKIRLYRSTAVVTSVADLDGTRNEQTLKGRYRYTRVYVRNSSGQWKIVSFEASRVEETDDRK